MLRPTPSDRFSWPAMVALAAATLASVLVASACDRGGAPEYVSFSEEIMATRVTVVVPRSHGYRAASVVFGVFREVDAGMSEWKATSPLSAVNRSAGEKAVRVPADLRAIMRRGVEIGNLTNGAFDLTWAALWGLWDFKSAQPRLPDDEEIERRLTLVDYRLIEIDDEAGTVLLPRAGMMVGLGGIAKGYALDVAAKALRERGANSFLISAGGQMLAGGRKGERSWRVGIRDPRGKADDYFAYLELSDASTSTSGDYESYFILDGVRYHHILDPRTGRPAAPPDALRSVTVVAADATLADALSTSFLILGTERSLAIAEETAGVEAVLVDARARVHTTSGLLGKLEQRHPPAM